VEGLLQTYLLVALGGIVGANARYAVSNLAVARWGAAFPYGTLLINITGSALLGFLLAALSPAANGWRVLLATGFCGGFTTFSTFAFETVALAECDERRAALANMAGSILLCIAAAALGGFVGRAFGGR
jgi:CrcB protein